MNDVKMNPVRELLLPLVERGEEFQRIITAVRVMDPELADELMDCVLLAENHFARANGDYAPRPTDFDSLCFDPLSLGDATFVSFQGESQPVELEEGMHRVWQSPKHSGCQHWCYFDATDQQMSEELARQQRVWDLAVRDLLKGYTYPFAYYLQAGDRLIVDTSAVEGGAAEPVSTSVPDGVPPVICQERAYTEAETTSPNCCGRCGK